MEHFELGKTKVFMQVLGSRLENRKSLSFHNNIGTTDAAAVQDTSDPQKRHMNKEDVVRRRHSACECRKDARGTLMSAPRPSPPSPHLHMARNHPTWALTLLLQPGCTDWRHKAILGNRIKRGKVQKYERGARQ